MQHLCFEVMFHMFWFHVTLIIICDYECKMMLMLRIWNANACLTPRVLHPPPLVYLMVLDMLQGMIPLHMNIQFSYFVFILRMKALIYCKCPWTRQCIALFVWSNGSKVVFCLPHIYKRVCGIRWVYKWVSHNHYLFMFKVSLVIFFLRFPHDPPPLHTHTHTSTIRRHVWPPRLAGLSLSLISVIKSSLWLLCMSFGSSVWRNN
jgi:hypothetical protein